MLWQGRLAFKQYIPSKRHRFGVKLYILCDCFTGFLLDFIIYTGSTTEYKHTKEFGASGSIVMSLMGDYLDEGHNLYADNWYSSPKLFEDLYQRRTGACGTIRKDRIGFPKFDEKLERGQQVLKHTKNLLALTWYDKREVHMLSTIHTTDMVASEKTDPRTKQKLMEPICIADYNNNMGAVD
ncbi:unnamed protein product [Adineta ricciae]|nr:unnamed protein product [Adineta ricciae]